MVRSKIYKTIKIILTMRDTRSSEIKKLLKKYYPNAIFKVRIHKYSMGESIYVTTNAFTFEIVPDPVGYGSIRKMSEQDRENKHYIEKLLQDYESVDRDESGDILSGGNTFLFVESL